MAASQHFASQEYRNVFANSVKNNALKFLVYTGAVLYVFTKGAKFSLFKPAEEMVFIALDEEARTKGKAAIDVVGGQAGKSGASILQQFLLLLTGGGVAGVVPVLLGLFVATSKAWVNAVNTLADFRMGSHDLNDLSSVEECEIQSLMTMTDEEDEEEGEGTKEKGKSIEQAADGNGGENYAGIEKGGGGDSSCYEAMKASTSSSTRSSYGNNEQDRSQGGKPKNSDEDTIRNKDGEEKKILLVARAVNSRSSSGSQ